MSRNHKINHEILDVFRNLIHEENLLLACTDEDLIAMLNDRLFVEHRISYRTFQRYKQRALREAHIPDADPLYLDLFHLIRRAYVKLKQQLLTAIIKDHQGSKRFMWILERKFREWNMRWTPSAAEEPVTAPIAKTIAETAVEQAETEPLPVEPEGAIIEEMERYPTYVGSYNDPHHPERPKDISLVHHGVYQGYVIPNPDYNGDEDDNTHAIKQMWNLLQEQRMEHDARMALIEQRRVERQRQEEEKRQQEVAEKAAHPPHYDEESEEKQYKDKNRARERLLAKIKSRGKGFHEEARDEDEYQPYSVD